MRIPLLMFCDAVLINMAIILPYFIRLIKQPLTYYFELSLIATPIILGIFYFSRLYHRVWAYASIGELQTILQSISIGSIAIIIIMHITNTPVPTSNVILFWAFGIIFVGGSRFAWRLFIENKQTETRPKATDCKKTLIYGAGDAGALVAREYKSHYNGSQPVIGFIDDDPQKHNLSIYGLPVLGGRDSIPSLVYKYGIDEIIIAMPSVSGNTIREIVQFCKESVASVKILPGVYQLLDGQVTINQIRPVDIEDLLGREPVQVNLQEISNYLKGKVVLVTGAGGSIGSELCRQIALMEPGKLVLLGHGENSVGSKKIKNSLHRYHRSIAIHKWQVTDFLCDYGANLDLSRGL